MDLIEVTKNAFLDELEKIARARRAALPIVSGTPERLDGSVDRRLDALYRQYAQTETGGQQLRSFLSGTGGLGLGAGVGAGLLGGGALGLNALAGRRMVSPERAALLGGGAGGIFGLGVGGVVGGSHGQADVDLGKLHEQIFNRESAGDGKISAGRWR